MTCEADYVIIGAGSAGCALASRTIRARREVLLAGGGADLVRQAA